VDITRVRARGASTSGASEAEMENESTGTAETLDDDSGSTVVKSGVRSSGGSKACTAKVGSATRGRSTIRPDIAASVAAEHA